VGIGTAAFLDVSDFDGGYQPLPWNPLFGGQSIYNGRIVFGNLPRTVVDDVLPPDLRLASNMTTEFPNEHPILLLFGHQTNTQWTFPWGPTNVGNDYRELILIIPFVQRVGGNRWHNYIVRIYLDNKPAELIGNWYYGYFKEMATLTEAVAAAAATLEVLHGMTGIKMFQWRAVPASTPFVSSSYAVANLENYQDAMQILTMPILGTLELGGAYVCSYWQWDLLSATVRPITVDLEFLEAFRVGMASWVALGPIKSLDQGAFEIQNIQWRMGYPPVSCTF
jgi:hypothetical protein